LVTGPDFECCFDHGKCWAVLAAVVQGWFPDAAWDELVRLREEFLAG
jgi:hypothetical protein